MEKNVQVVYDRLARKEYKKFRNNDEYDFASEFAAKNIPLCIRAAERLLKLSENEKAIVYEGDKIGFARTICKIPPLLTSAEQAEIKSNHFIFDGGRVFNISSNFGRIISSGFESVEKEIYASKNKFNKESKNALELDAMLISIKAVYIIAEKYRAQAEKKGCDQLAAALGNIPRHGAKSFHEALVFLRLLNFTLWLNGNKHNTIGRFDAYMYQFYNKDISSGKITSDEALALVEEFFISLNFDADLYPGIQQGDNGQSLMLGGVDKNGNCSYNSLSELSLRASLALSLIDPKINLRVDKNTKDEVYQLGALLTKQGLGFPQYSNDDIVIDALEQMGYDSLDARDYTVAACWEFIIPGKGMDIPNIDAINFPKIVNDAVFEIAKNEKQEKNIDFSRFMAIIEERIDSEVEKVAVSVKNIFIEPSPFQSILMDDCIEHGRDIADGGKYNNYGLHGVGISHAADALASIKKNIFELHNFDFTTLTKAISQNFNGYENERTQMLSAPKMGNNDNYVDDIAIDILNAFSASCKSRKNERGGVFRAGTGTAMYYEWFASDLGATADGREAGQPFSANYSPSIGARTNGVLSVIQSFTKPDLKKTCNGGPLTLEFHDTVFRNADGVNKVALLVKAFIHKGGHQLQLNAVNRDTLLEAKAFPELYKNLIVRVWGWSGYFTELDETYQDHVIKRLEYEV